MAVLYLEHPACRFTADLLSGALCGSVEVQPIRLESNHSDPAGAPSWPVGGTGVASAGMVLAGRAVAVRVLPCLSDALDGALS